MAVARRAAALALAATPLASLAGAPKALGQGTPAIAEASRANVVRVQAAGQLGFGFVVGFADGDLVVATAWHTLERTGVQEATICFFHRPRDCTTASLVHVADPIGTEPALDLALLAVEPPEGLPWRPDVVAPAFAPGEPVWFVGRMLQWYVPPEPGTLGEHDPGKRTLAYSGLPVARGVSGAPILTQGGMVAMHVESEGAMARGVEMEAIRGRLERQLRGHWILRPSDSCEDGASAAPVLEGEAVTVHLDPARPDAAVEAMIRLACAGVQVMPAVAEDGAWPGNRIAYGSGRLPFVRALQGLLAPLGRLETRLDAGLSGAAVWVR